VRDFFSLEGSFNKYAGFLADTLILSLLWIFFSLPVVTIGASTSALFYVATRRIANREGYISSDFWQAFKVNFKRGTIIWLLVFFVSIVIIWNMMLAIQEPEIMGAFATMILPAQVVLLVLVSFVATFAFPVTARFDMGVRETLKTCFFMAIKHLFTSVSCVALLITLVGVSLFFWEPLLFMTPGIYGMLASYLIMRVFKKYRPEMDKDPVLELQEIEQKRAEEKRRRELGLGFTAEADGNIIEEKFEEEENEEVRVEE